MRNKAPETVSEALAYAHTLEQLQEAVRLRRLWNPSPTDLTGRAEVKVDPFETPFSDKRNEFDKTEG
jgi:hypothetical protein